MLLRMYVRWGEKQRYKTRVVEKSMGEEAGIKSATLEIEGRYAYGYLSGEKGTHRIVRQSPFNAKGLRQVPLMQFLKNRKEEQRKKQKEVGYCKKQRDNTVEE